MIGDKLFKQIDWKSKPIDELNVCKMSDGLDCAERKSVEETKMKPKTCINCCAPLHSNVCEYCGSVYEVENNVEEYEIDSYRDAEGNLHRRLLKSGIKTEDAINIMFSCGGCI